MPYAGAPPPFAPPMPPRPEVDVATPYAAAVLAIAPPWPPPDVLDVVEPPCPPWPLDELVVVDAPYALEAELVVVLLPQAAETASPSRTAAPARFTTALSRASFSPQCGQVLSVVFA